MKFIYIDESGKDQDSKHAVLCGVSFDHNRMRKTKESWLNFLNWLNEEQGIKTSEMHTAQFFAGKGVWNKLSADVRKTIIRAIVEWLNKRSHKFCIVAADKKEFKKMEKKHPFCENIWFFLATHLIFSFSKTYQKEKGVKGDFVTVFDNGCVGAEFYNFITSSEANELFNKYIGKKGVIKLSDTPFSADSKHSSLIQIADFIAFFCSRKIELESGGDEKYDGEKGHMDEFYKGLINNKIENRFFYKKTKRTDIEEIFFCVAPRFIKE